MSQAESDAPALPQLSARRLSVVTLALDYAPPDLPEGPLSCGTVHRVSDGVLLVFDAHALRFGCNRRPGESDHLWEFAIRIMSFARRNAAWAVLFAAHEAGPRDYEGEFVEVARTSVITGKMRKPYSENTPLNDWLQTPAAFVLWDPKTAHASHELIG